MLLIDFRFFQSEFNEIQEIAITEQWRKINAIKHFGFVNYD